jgi:putative sterol carrier protein
MSIAFPSTQWLRKLETILNSDKRYAQIARNWEGDINFVILPAQGEGDLHAPVVYYLDLWHGKCRQAREIDPQNEEMPEARFTLTASLSNYRKILEGELDPMQAMVTRRLKVEGSLTYMLRNVPVVLDFVRCCRLALQEEGGG